MKSSGGVFKVFDKDGVVREFDCLSDARLWYDLISETEEKYGT